MSWDDFWNAVHIVDGRLVVDGDPPLSMSRFQALRIAAMFVHLFGEAGETEFRKRLADIRSGEDEALDYVRID